MYDGVILCEDRYRVVKELCRTKTKLLESSLIKGLSEKGKNKGNFEDDDKEFFVCFGVEDCFKRHFLIFMCMGVSPICIFTYHICEVPKEAKRWCQIPLDCS